VEQANKRGLELLRIRTSRIKDGKITIGEVKECGQLVLVEHSNKKKGKDLAPPRRGKVDAAGWTERKEGGGVVAGIHKKLAKAPTKRGKGDNTAQKPSKFSERERGSRESIGVTGRRVFWNSYMRSRRGLKNIRAKEKEGKKESLREESQLTKGTAGLPEPTLEHHSSANEGNGDCWKGLLTSAKGGGPAWGPPKEWPGLMPGKVKQLPRRK